METEAPPHTIIIKGKGSTAAWWTEQYLSVYPWAEVWTLNDDRHPKATRHFEMHRPRHHITEDLTCPVMIHWDDEPRYENEQRFPMAAVRSRFMWLYDFSSTPAYMLALAAYLRAAHVCLPGIDFTGNFREFSEERHACEKWIAALVGQGCSVHIPDTSALMKREVFYA